MSEFRRVTDAFSVAPQMAVDDVARAANAGFKLLINNRPDGEAEDQPDGSTMAQAADDAGMAYVYIPVRGGPTREQAQAFTAAIEEAQGPVLAFCRSGTRSINTWALGQALEGAPRDGLLSAGAAAGYDLSAILG